MISSNETFNRAVLKAVSHIGIIINEITAYYVRKDCNLKPKELNKYFGNHARIQAKLNMYLYGNMEHSGSIRRDTNIYKDIMSLYWFIKNRHKRYISVKLRDYYAKELLNAIDILDEIKTTEHQMWVESQKRPIFMTDLYKGVKGWNY